MVGEEIAPVDDRVPKGFVGVVYTDLRTDTPSNALIRSRLHLGEMLQIVFDAILAML